MQKAILRINSFLTVFELRSSSLANGHCKFWPIHTFFSEICYFAIRMQYALNYYDDSSLMKFLNSLPPTLDSRDGRAWRFISLVYRLWTTHLVSFFQSFKKNCFRLFLKISLIFHLFCLFVRSQIVCSVKLIIF